MSTGAVRSIEEWPDWLKELLVVLFEWLLGRLKGGGSDGAP